MVNRKQYLKKLEKLKDKQLIKIITGVRRSGKSTLLLQFMEYLLENNINKEEIIYINFENLEYEHLKDYKKLYNYINDKLLPNKKNYIFLDEIQEVDQFQKTIDSLFIKNNTDIYITGSNAKMLSSELATLLSGRYIEISILPLSFKEFFELSNLNKNDAWNFYFYNGGFPYLHQIEDENIKREYLFGIYNTVLLKDIVAKNKIQDITLLESIIKFVFNNIGNIVSSKKIADTLISYGGLMSRKRTS